MTVYKIFRAAEWAAFRDAGRTGGSPADRADGFIHLSGADQLAGTAAKHFAGEDGLVLVAVRAGDIVWEPSRGGALFPHLYRPLTLADTLWSKPLPLGPGGHQIPDLP